MSKLITESAAAAYLGIPSTELRRLRCEGRVPAQQITLRAALYDTDDLDAYVLKTTRHRTYRIGGDTITVLYDEDRASRHMPLVVDRNDWS